MGKPKNSMKAQLERRIGQSRTPKAKVDESVPETHKQRCPARQGRKMIAGYFDPTVHRQLKLIGLEEDKTIQDLLEEALNGLFANHGKPPIA